MVSRCQTSPYRSKHDQRNRKTRMCWGGGGGGVKPGELLAIMFVGYYFSRLILKIGHNWGGKKARRHVNIFSLYLCEKAVLRFNENS